MSGIRYSKDHEWLAPHDTAFRCGISKHAAEKLGDIVFVELPQPGDSVEAGAPMAVVESVKAASDVYAPCSGVVREVNAVLSDTPETVNADPEGAGWFAVIDPADGPADGPACLDALMDASAYARYCEED